MTDLDKFDNKVREILITSLFDQANPIDYSNITADSINGREKQAFYNYMHDYIFKRRVDQIASLIMRELNETITEKELC